VRLAEFLAGQQEDPNLFWRLSSGDHQNLLEEACDQLDAVRRQLVEVNGIAFALQVLDDKEEDER
jgi:hypothetical protein